MKQQVLLTLCVLATLTIVYADEDLVDFIVRGRHKRAAVPDCDILDPACRRAIDAGNAIARRGDGPDPNFAGGKCDYEDQMYWLIPGQADNSTCTRTETFTKGLKIRILNDTVKISPNPVRLPACFDLSFEVEINNDIKKVPRSFLGKNEFQLYELPEFEKMQCQNASNDGCGGYGNNCMYCDMCEQFKKVRDSDPVDTGDEATDEFLDQFDEVKCPDSAGRYQVKRKLCFNDWAVMDQDKNCKLDMLENLTEDGNEEDADTIKQAGDTLLGGRSTLISRFYLSHNSTKTQQIRQRNKEIQIKTQWNAKLKKRRVENAWAISDAEFKEFVDWYVKFQIDSWHKDSFLPWLLFENELACLKITFNVCDKEPVAANANCNDWRCKLQQRNMKCPGT